MLLKIISDSPEKTVELGEKFSSVLSAGDIMLLSGELGGGKTTFISGIARGLGIKNSLSSPSFTIMNEYPGKRFNFIHADLYRLNNASDFSTTGLEDYIYDDSSIVCMEWGDRAGGFIARDHILIEFNYLLGGACGINKREITFRADSSAWERKLSAFMEFASIPGQ
ncbi:MAG: tRNA (adenosine(37)-N6)-threonylcarbamoyltransferase complex ATPase subunit type 1 TsaE [Actinobacteria bacterium]|nr:tRNA (adenosine(37)-N6)-threonylcarbamoyltransferase complex ATPase subunit type 1 TsaE [Actinomycetota bacterium]